MSRRLSKASLAVLLGVGLATSGCESLNPFGGSGGAGPGDPGFIKGFAGAVAADEPQAAAVARDVLSAGGTAADAAVALGFALSVTLPSRAGLGGGGACLAYAPGSDSPNKGVPEALLFVSPSPGRASQPANAGPSVATDRPAAVPMLARALYALRAKYGDREFESLIAPAERMAREGILAPRALVRDLAVVAGPLAADPGARAVFFPGGQPAGEGARLVEPGLATTLGALRSNGVGALYVGPLARRLAQSARDAGGGLTEADLRDALPVWAPALTVAAGRDTAAFLPPPADGGLAAAAAFQTLRADPTAMQAAGGRALAVAARWRQGGIDARALLSSATLPAGSLPSLPASTSFAVVDRQGRAVTCALTMNNLFGTGRIAAGTGLLLAASPAALPPPLLSAALATNPDDGFRAAVAGSGQAGAPLAVASALAQTLAETGPRARPLQTPVPDPGRANVIACTRYLPDTPASCGWATDARGAGVAIAGAP